eukprot:NODE_2505_length_2201_cov_3.691900.p1 GENE.NODE_2505_length_2201_cov_3.691900~~NODE_2505_length_2201_cov_3.691900.p1  ORF type:complete len:326 (+),score=39.83 NODE_2505_length_2201_cov_3.691900:1135-2112(+)
MVATPWSLAALYVTHQPLLSSLAAAARPTIAVNFVIAQLSNLAWSASPLKYPDKPLRPAIASSSLRNISAFAAGAAGEAPTLVKFAWAFAPWAEEDCPLLAAISASAIRMIQLPATFCDVDYASLAWSLATLRLRNLPLMDAIASQSIRNIRDFERGSLSMTAWASADCEVMHSPLLHAIAASSIPPISDFDPQSIANTAWSFAALNLHHHPCRASIAAASRPRLSFSPPHCIATVWSFAPMAVCLPRRSAQSPVAAPPDLLSTLWAVDVCAIVTSPLSADTRTKPQRSAPRYQLPGFAFHFMDIRPKKKKKKKKKKNTGRKTSS